METQNQKRPRILTQPGMIVLLVILLALAVEFLLTTDFLNDRLQVYVGLGIVGLALLWMIWAVLQFWEHRTPVWPDSDSKVLLTNGPYRLTRNPLYVGLMGIQLGMGVVVDSVWIVLLLPLSAGVLYMAVIRSEESFLESKFTEEYRAYKTRVRRWF